MNCDGGQPSCVVFGSGTPLGLPGSEVGTPAETRELRPVLGQNAPNPFRPSTTIRFQVAPGAPRTVLRVYDTSGRLVRTLVDAVLAPGPHEARWDGCGESGRRLPAGVYMYALDGQRAAARRMVLLR